MQAESDEIELPDLLELLQRRIWFIVGCFLLCLCVGIFLSLAPRKYVADSLLRVQLGSDSQYRSSPSAPASAASADEFSPYVDILTSRTLYLRVASDLNLANNAAFLGHPVSGNRSLDDPSVRNEVLRAMQAQIAVSHKPKDEMIRVSCSTQVPMLSARITNTLVNDFVDILIQTHYGATKRASGWLVSQLDDLKRQVQQDQEKLTSLQAKLGIIGVSDKDPDYLLAQSLGDLTKASSSATIDRILAEAKYRFLSQSDPSLIEGEISLLGGAGGGNSGTNAQPGNLLQSLRDSQAVQASDYARLLQQFGPNYPDVVQKRAQLDETTRQVKSEQARILNQAKLSYNAAADNERLTQQQLSATQGKAFDLRNEMVQYVILQHDYDSHRSLYESLISRLREAGITAGLGSGEVDIVDLADVPTRPAPPGKLTYLGGSALAGLILGCLLAIVLEAFNCCIITVGQARRVTTSKLLAVIPFHKFGSRLLTQQQDSSYVEAIEGLRSALVNQAAPPQVILFTSTHQGEGKTTTSVALATVLAQHGSSCLLVDCDLRNNTVASQLRLPGANGLSSVLTGKSELASALQGFPECPGLNILVSGDTADARPAILLGSDRARNFIADVRERYDFIILKSPPVLGVSDVLELAPVADATVLVVRSSATRRRNLELAEQILEDAGVAPKGYVLNGLKDTSIAFFRRPADATATQQGKEVTA